MRTFFLSFVALLLRLPAAAAQTVRAAPPPESAPAAGDENTQLRQELEQMQKAVAALEQRLTAQEKAAQEKKEETKQALASDQPTTAELATQVKDLDHRVNLTERRGALDRINFTGDYRFEAHSIWGNVPAHYDGMQLQNLVVKSLFYVNTNARAFPPSAAAITNNLAQNYATYQHFTNNLTFSQLKAAMAQFPPAMQHQLFGMLQPATYV